MADGGLELASEQQIDLAFIAKGISFRLLPRAR
jgi:hypothetical protein